jgi:hypothetical protein
MKQGTKICPLVFWKWKWITSLELIHMTAFIYIIYASFCQSFSFTLKLWNTFSEEWCFTGKSRVRREYFVPHYSPSWGHDVKLWMPSLNKMLTSYYIFMICHNNFIQVWLSAPASGNQNGNWKKWVEDFLNRKFEIYIIININMWQYISVLLLKDWT